jgi:hypothetical protein
LGKVALLLTVTVLVGAGGASRLQAATLHSPDATPDPTRFVAGVNNPWFPLRPGTRYVYHGVEEGKPSLDVVTVTAKTKVIEGVNCTAVSDLLYLAGRLRERTTDWYAQDRFGTVWYFGEDTAELNARGDVISREGSWLAGRYGAKAGIFMPAHPRVGQSFRQEFYGSHAEDHFQVLNLAATVRTPAASSKHALLTKEWSPLEPDVIDHKLYVRGVGMVKENTVKGPLERGELVAVHRS